MPRVAVQRSSHVAADLACQVFAPTAVVKEGALFTRPRGALTTFGAAISVAMDEAQRWRVPCSLPSVLGGQLLRAHHETVEITHGSFPLQPRRTRGRSHLGQWAGTRGDGGQVL